MTMSVSVYACAFTCVRFYQVRVEKSEHTRCDLQEENDQQNP